MQHLTITTEDELLLLINTIQSSSFVIAVVYSSLAHCKFEGYTYKYDTRSSNVTSKL